VAASSSVGKICMFAYHTRHQDYTKEAKEEVRATLWQTKRSGMLSRAPEGRPEGNTMRLAGVVPALRGSGIGTVERKSKDSLHPCIRGGGSERAPRRGTGKGSAVQRVP
jgi:hypothetical protein